MSLAGQIDALATRLAQEVNALRVEIAAGGGGGGANIKAGTATFNTDTWTVIAFNTAFDTTPKVVVTANQDSTARWDFTPIIRNVTVNGFDCRYDDRAQTGAVIVNWVATDAGNP